MDLPKPEMTVNIINCTEGIIFWAKKTRKSCPKEWKDLEDLENTFRRAHRLNQLNIEENLQIRNLVVVFDRFLEKFVRCKISQIGDDECEIFTVDYGTFFKVPLNKIYEAPLHAYERDGVKFQALPILLDKTKPKDFDLQILRGKMKKWRSDMGINENVECYLTTHKMMHHFHIGEIRFINKNKIVSFSSSLCEHGIAEIDICNIANNTKANEFMELTIKEPLNGSIPTSEKSRPIQPTPSTERSGPTRTYPSTSSLNQNHFVGGASTSQEKHSMPCLDEVRFPTPRPLNSQVKPARQQRNCTVPEIPLFEFDMGRKTHRGRIGPKSNGRPTENSSVNTSPRQHLNHESRDPVPILIRGHDKETVKSVNFGKKNHSGSIGPKSNGRPTENSSVNTSPRQHINTESRDPVPILIRGHDKETVKSVNLQDVPLNKYVKDLLVKKLGWKDFHQIQKYMMMSILSNKDIVAVDEKNYGKSSGYVVPLSSLMYDNNLYAEVMRYKGPRILVICPFSESIDKIVAMFKLLTTNEIFDHKHNYANNFSGPKERIKVLAVCSISEEANEKTMNEYINGVDIVVANPQFLLRLIDKSPGVIGDFSRLCHLVIDDANFTFNKYALQEIIGYIKKSLKVRPPTMNPLQTICCSQYWTKDLGVFVTNLMKSPPVLINSPFEAMTYGNVKFIPRKYTQQQKSAKMKQIKETIMEYKSAKIVVSCSNEEERQELENVLTPFVDILLPENPICSLTEARVFESQWKKLYGGDAVPVFLATDDTLEKVNITDADCLIKYSISSKSAFHKSLSCLYDRFLINGIDPDYKTVPGQSKPKVCLFLNENLTECELEIVLKCDNYLRETNQDNSEFQSFIDELVRKKNTEGRLCNNLLNSGRCFNEEKLTCSDRHVFIKDTDQITDDTPTEGELVVTIQNVHSASHFSGEIRKRKNTTGVTETITNEINTSMNNYYGNVQNRGFEENENSVVENLGKCTFKFQAGNLFSAPNTTSLAHSIAADLQMGKGIALQFKERFGRIDELQEQNKEEGETVYLKDGQRYIFYLLNRKYANDKTSAELLQSSIINLKELCIEYNITELAIPKIGKGYNDFPWSEVKKYFLNTFSDYEITITCYNNVLLEYEDDLFNAPENYSLAHCVALDFQMTSGIAKTFNKNFGRQDFLRQLNKNLGDVAYLIPKKGPKRYIFYLITKEKSTYDCKPNMRTFKRSLFNLRSYCDEFGVKDLAIPRIGTGIDKLDWQLVKEMLMEMFMKTNTTIHVYTLPDQPPPKKRIQIINSGNLDRVSGNNDEEGSAGPSNTNKVTFGPLRRRITYENESTSIMSTGDLDGVVSSNNDEEGSAGPSNTINVNFAPWRRQNQYENSEGESTSIMSISESPRMSPIEDSSSNASSEEMEVTSSPESPNYSPAHNNKTTIDNESLDVDELFDEILEKARSSSEPNDEAQQSNNETKVSSNVHEDLDDKMVEDELDYECDDDDDDNPVSVMDSDTENRLLNGPN